MSMKVFDPPGRMAVRRATPAAETANERLKRRFADWFWSSMVVATLLHAGLFVLAPGMTVADIGTSGGAVESIELPPDVELPPAPEEIARPARPVIPDADVDDDLTIGQTTLEENPVPTLPPPAARGDEDRDRFEQIVPSMVIPELLNRDEMQRELERRYPPMLRDAGIGGTVLIQFWIDEEGRVVRTEIQRSSGYERMDRAALDVADIMEFSPALSRDLRVAVVVAFPISFRVR